MRRACFTLLLLILWPLSGVGQTFTKSSFESVWWIGGSMGIAPDSGVVHGDASVVGSRRDFFIRAQPGVLGLMAGYHTNAFHSIVDQESFDVHNSVYSVGGTIRTGVIDEASGAWGGTHLIWNLLYQWGRSDAHVFNGPAGGTQSEVSAEIVHASGYAGGVDGFFPLVWGAWVFAGAGLESLEFHYEVPTDPNGDGRVNIRRTFSYLRAGAAVSF